MDINKEDEEILVVNSELDERDTKDADASPIWFSNPPKDEQLYEKAELGDKVEIKLKDVMESYPGQALIEDIKILSTQTEDGADLSQSEVLREVLEKNGEEMMELYETPGSGGAVPIVRSMDYDSEADEWNVKIISQSATETVKEYPEFKVKDE
nr:DUF3221 domain-containing protein [Halobacillus sp. A1]